MSETRWTRMKAKTPAKDGPYIVYAPTCDPKSPFMVQAWWHTDEQRWGLIRTAWAKLVTHWMPMPAPPRRKKKPN